MSDSLDEALEDLKCRELLLSKRVLQNDESASLDAQLQELAQREAALLKPEYDQSALMADTLGANTEQYRFKEQRHEHESALLDAELAELARREQQLLELDKQEAQCSLPEAHEIMPDLFVGSKEAALEVSGSNTLRISHVLNVDGDISATLQALQDAGSDVRSCSKDGITTQVVPLDDSGQTVLTEDLLLQCFKFIRAGRSTGGRVLVHCALGVNRSVTVAAAFLMWDQGMSADAALELIREAHPCANPVQLYRDQLRSLEASCLVSTDA
eukprot:TRINITY_DN92833_c0_g1_i1.p1 TRINITY_DN92833_c0_g1~~TRINITY_DN92833_c0_g1_i1.p1  ORF type:complete len:271 (+),score=63.15 TRINITY_DN92833_c0_g1_i1:245-1057(+)